MGKSGKYNLVGDGQIDSAPAERMGILDEGSGKNQRKLIAPTLIQPGKGLQKVIQIFVRLVIAQIEDKAARQAILFFDSVEEEEGADGLQFDLSVGYFVGMLLLDFGNPVLLRQTPTVVVESPAGSGKSSDERGDELVNIGSAAAGKMGKTEIEADFHRVGLLAVLVGAAGSQAQRFSKDLGIEDSPDEIAAALEGCSQLVQGMLDQFSRGR